MGENIAPNKTNNGKSRSQIEMNATTVQIHLYEVETMSFSLNQRRLMID